MLLLVTVIGPGIAAASTRSPWASSTRQHASTTRVLNLAWTFPDMSPDPASWYGVNNELETALYQGLLQFAPNTTHMVADLARSYSVSPDGKTYTFDLHSGVMFHDGTPFDCPATKFSFQRRITIAAGPSYMLANVKSMSCPSPITFVVTLTEPTAAFLDYMCSPHGPNMVRPTATAKHLGSKADHGQTWLATHDAGTGPYNFVKQWDRARAAGVVTQLTWWG